MGVTIEDVGVTWEIERSMIVEKVTSAVTHVMARIDDRSESVLCQVKTRPTRALMLLLLPFLLLLFLSSLFLLQLLLFLLLLLFRPLIWSP